MLLRQQVFNTCRTCLTTEMTGIFLMHLEMSPDKIKLCRACRATIRTMKAEGAAIMDEGVATTTLLPSWLWARVQQALKLK